MEIREDGNVSFLLFILLYLSIQNYMLAIRNVAPYDAANYTCQLSDDVEIMHKLTVYVPPKVTLSLNQILTRQGENVTVRCFGSGHPLPQIKWKRLVSASKFFYLFRIYLFKGNAIPVSATVAKDGTLHLPEIEISSAGAYECQASNGYGNPANAKVDISVHGESLFCVE